MASPRVEQVSSLCHQFVEGPAHHDSPKALALGKGSDGQPVPLLQKNDCSLFDSISGITSGSFHLVAVVEAMG